MIVAAKDTKPGRKYRLRKEMIGQTHYERTLTPASKYVKSLRGKSKHRISMDEIRLIEAFDRDPTLVLMRRVMVGFDTFTKAFFEKKTLLLVPGDHPFEEIEPEPS